MTIYTTTKEKVSKLLEETQRENSLGGGVGSISKRLEDSKASWSWGVLLQLLCFKSHRPPKYSIFSPTLAGVTISVRAAEGMKRGRVPCETAGGAHATISVCHYTVTIFMVQTYCFCNWRTQAEIHKNITTDKLIKSILKDTLKTI